MIHGELSRRRPLANDARQLPLGLRFTEHMSGFVGVLGDPLGDFQAAAAMAEGANGRMDTNLVISYEDFEALLDDPSLPADVHGEIEVPSLSPTPMHVVSGTFVMRIKDPERVETANMLYQLLVRACDGVEYEVTGVKYIRLGPLSRSWRDTTTLFTTITRHAGPMPGEVVAKGILRVSPNDFRRLLTSVEIVNAGDWPTRERCRLAFAAHFFGPLVQYYGGVFEEGRRFPTPAPHHTALPQPGGAMPDAVRWCDPRGTWHDEVVPGACSRLIRYRGGPKGPVMLAPGFAMSATSFALDSGRPSLAEYLLSHGYDVWLFDYRAGIDLPSAWSPSTIDQIASVDWPRAVAEVRRAAGSADVQVFGHCVGAVSLQMALLSGMTGVRSAVCAQFSVHPVTSRLNRTKAALHLGTILADLGLARVQADTRLSVVDVALDLALHPVPLPRDEQCGLAICRWLNAIFGLTHVHAQLDDETHEGIPSLFGVGNLRGLRHLLLMLQREAAVTATGLDLYLPRVGDLSVPIHFIAGMRNYIFHPEGTERTIQWLRRARDPGMYSVTYLDDYGHLDAIIGRNAASDVFPTIQGQLEEHALASR